MAIGRFVSRGGEKLEGALDHFKINVEGMICLDAGASTGGFTDCLLQRNVSKVYAVDTAYGELAWKLRNDKRVTVLERTNLLYGVKPLDETGEKVDLVAVDLGWTKLHLAIPKILEYLKPGGSIVALIKPQYEFGVSQKGGGNVESKGVLTEDYAYIVASKVRGKLQEMGLLTSELFASPVKGEGGNQEYFVVLKKQ
ncbi:MAG: hypothetical protein UW69_C0048G0005 [Microgenomates group bacterium GW2011_GWA2_44_7]|nr:MAG: hypothetical protein UW69_C0048G0005 [Microgenomates group bacterium GW2011_GWA2_44_7]KKT77443.1 MAG: hypothetical protein UW73_C0020G0015 [Microgenomates group bacterium GW2011_GWB1_44_8]